jgi:hypothetical protein
MKIAASKIVHLLTIFIFILYGNAFGQISGQIFMASLESSNPINTNDYQYVHSISETYLPGIQLPQFNISINQVAYLTEDLSSDNTKCSTQKINILFKNIK